MTNRAKRRADAARDKMQANAERMLETDEANQARAMAALEAFRTLLFATARREGRLLVRREDLEALGEHDSVSCVVRENGDVVVEFKAGA